MSGAYLENLDHVFPGLHAVLSDSSDLRGTATHIIKKSRTIKKNEGIHRLSVDQLLLMMAYWTALSVRYDERSSGHELNFWHSDRIAVYSSELFRRGIADEHNPNRDRFATVTKLLFGSLSK